MSGKARWRPLLILAMLCVVTGCGDGEEAATWHPNTAAVKRHKRVALLIRRAEAIGRSRGLQRDGHRTQRPADPFDFGNPAFCGEASLVRDFGLGRFPPVQEPPRSGDLPFGPKTVSLVSSNGDPILHPGEDYGYQLFSENYRGHTQLHWRLNARLMSVDRAGRVLREVDRKTVPVRMIGSGEEWRVDLRPPHRLGVYRYDLRITSRSGAELAHYEQYLRVVRLLWGVRLGLNKSRFKPGETVLSRIENLGSDDPIYGAYFKVQQRVGGRWVHPPALPRIGSWDAWSASVPPGETGRCNAIWLPADMPDGHYRMIKDVGDPEEERGATLVAPFEVVGHAPLLKRAQAHLLHLYTLPEPLPQAKLPTRLGHRRSVVRRRASG